MPRIRLLLLLSLIGNLFAVGLLAGGLVSLSFGGGGLFGNRARAIPARPLFEAGAGLPIEDRRRFVAVLRAANREARPLRRDAAENRRLAADLFAAPSFDRAAAGQALDRARTDDAALREALENAALDFAATLPPVERRALARALARGGPLRHRAP